jgi:hypothetical protein
MVNWGRHTLGTVPFVILFSAYLGASGVMIGQAVGGVIFAGIAVWQALRAMEKPGQDRPIFGREGRLTVLFGWHR